jgi:hypothetical protein
VFLNVAQVVDLQWWCALQRLLGGAFEPGLPCGAALIWTVWPLLSLPCRWPPQVLEVMTDRKIAFCQTPQAFDNITQGQDIFNNINLQVLGGAQAPSCSAFA